MEVSKYKCDICGNFGGSEEYNTPDGWLNIHIPSRDDKDFWQTHKDICNECAEPIIAALRELHA